MTSESPHNDVNESDEKGMRCWEARNMRVVVLQGSPNRKGSTAQLKTVIDRFCSANFSITGKQMRSALLAVAWNADGWTFDAIEAHYDTLVRYLHLQDAGRVLGAGCGTPSATSKSRFMRQAYELGRSI